jgi:hypothetical protein
MAEERVQKILSRAGHGSRRGCEKFIEEGRVTVNGEKIELGAKADPKIDDIQLDGISIGKPQKKVYIALNKPKNMLSLNAPEDPRPTIFDLIPDERHLYPVGRLDFDSEGLVLLTNDGRLANLLTHPRYDEIITSNLSKLNNEYTFFVYTSPVPMLLTSPHGIWIPVPVAVGGEIYYDGKWRQKGGNVMLKIFGQENLSKPEKDIAAREDQVRKFLEENLGKDSIPSINNILVSLHPKAIIGNVEDAPTTIVEVEALRRTIRKVDRKREEEISPELLNKINDLFKTE